MRNYRRNNYITLTIVSALFICFCFFEKNTLASSNTKNDSQYSFTVNDYYFEPLKRTAIYIKINNKLERVGAVDEGQVYPRIGDTGAWHIIKFGNDIGYVKKEFTKPTSGNTLKNLNNSYQHSNQVFTPTRNIAVYDTSSGKSVQFASLYEGIEYPMISDIGDWYRIDLAGRIGYIRESDVKLEFSSTVNHFEALFRTAIYVKENNKLTRVGAVDEGQVYPRIGDTGAWHIIKFGNNIGYVNKENTQPSNGSGIFNKNTSYKNSTLIFEPTKNIAVYDTSSGRSVRFASLYKGIKYPLVSDIGDWYRIDLSGRIGYIKEKDVQLVFSSAIKYFEATRRTAVYIKENNKLIRSGALDEGQAYPRIGDTGAWHIIKFGDGIGYVNKEYTKPSFGGQLNNMNSVYKNSGEFFTPNKNIAVYDTSSGRSVQFGSLYKGVNYPYIYDIGDWLRVDLAGRIGYVREKDVQKLFNSNTKFFEATKRTAIYEKKDGKLIRVGAIDEGETYPRIGDTGDWHIIEFGNAIGYVKKAYTKPGNSYAIKNINNVYKNSPHSFIPTKNIAVYDTSSGKSVKFASLYQGVNYPFISDIGDWLMVDLSGRIGYIRESDVDVKLAYKDIVNPRQEYTYEQMKRDINSLKKMYPGIIQTSVIGKSVDGRDLIAVRLGKGKTEIHLNGSTHAREWLTTNLLMEMIDQYSQAYVKNQSFHGYDVKKILEQSSIWFIPMVNPDGVTLVQKGAYSAKNPVQVLSINKGSHNFNAWKANIRGVDLNRQFPTDWNYITNDPGRRAPYNFKGYSPFTEPEAKALAEFTKNHNFKSITAYHSSGEILYFGDDKFSPNSKMYKLSKDIANMVSAKTGYSLYYTRGLPGGGTYTDWVQGELKTVGLTPEISPYVGNRPVPISSFNSIWKENNTIGLMLALEAINRK